MRVSELLLYKPLAGDNLSLKVIFRASDRPRLALATRRTGVQVSLNSLCVFSLRLVMTVLVRLTLFDI